ncbi:MAG: succinylglutamate desuccinylase/aspartoacylase family protein [Gemmatimonadales bacterium]
MVNGSRPGPVVAFVAGSHGTEYTSIVAMTRLIGRIDPRTLAGTVIVVPLVNVASFEQMVPHINPVDRKGMNAGYPGDPNGTQSLRAVALIADQVVKPADVVVDLHGGDLDEDLRPYSYWIRSGNLRKDADSRLLALAFGLNMVIVRDIDVSNPASTRSLSGYSIAAGKTTLVAEAGHAGVVTKAETDALVDGSLNVLKALKMVGGPTTPVPRVTWVGADQRVRADSGGMFYPSVTKGSKVEKGAKVGWITDYVGRPMGDVLAPQAGVVTFIRPVPSLTRGATIVTVAQVYGATAPAYVKPAP